MLNRIPVVILALSLSAVAMLAQHRGVGSFGRAGSYGFGHFRIGSGLAPFTGFGDINHPGLGFAPNTPGIGYPLTPGPLRPGAFGFCAPGTYGRPYPYGYPYPSGYHYSYGYGYGLGGVAVVGVPVGVGEFTSPVGQAPQVIIIQLPPGQGQGVPVQVPPQESAGQLSSEQKGEKKIILTYESRRPTPQKAPTPLTLLVFKDHSIRAVTRYWKEGDRLNYVTSYGAQKSVALNLLDLEFTKKLNEERNVTFEP